MTRRWLLAAAVPVFLAGACDKTNWESSIFRDKRFTKGESERAGYLVTDAKQRVVLNVPNSRAPAGTNENKANGEQSSRSEAQVQRRIICAEPSPDVSQALSEALKLAVEVRVEGRGEGSLGIDRSFSHSIAQLGERLAVIQLLRDKMYRACEAYANGAVEASGYTLMLARLDKTMTTLLSAEMVAGAFGRSLAQLGGGAGTGGIDRKEIEKAKAEVEKASDDLRKASEETDAVKRKDAADKASGALQKATEKLFALELQAARTYAAGTVLTASLGKIEGRTGGTDSSGTVPGSIVSLHRNYLDDHGLEPLIDACVVAMDAVKPSSTAKTAALKAVAETLEADKAARPARPANGADGKGGDSPGLDEKLYKQIVSAWATEGSPFAAFCALRVMTSTNHRHGFIRHFTTLKRDLRGSRITGAKGKNGEDEPVIIAPVEERAYRRCITLAAAMAVHVGKPDEVKTEAAEFQSNKCAEVLR